MAVRVPPAEVIGVTLPFLASFLWRLALIEISDLPTLRVSSWYRDVADNRRVGGLPDSQHQLGLALDVGGDPADRERFLERARLVGLTAIGESAHAHLQLLPAGRARNLGLFPD